MHFHSVLSLLSRFIFSPCLKMIPSKSQQNILAFFSSTLGFSVTNCINIFQTGILKGLNYCSTEVCISADSHVQEEYGGKEATPEHNTSGIRGLLSSCKSGKEKYLPHTLSTARILSLPDWWNKCSRWI